MERPKTRYARSGELSIAYQVVGDGPRDLVYVPGAISHLDFAWDHPGYVRFMRRLAAIARVIVFDRRGMGLSDPVSEAPAVEERVGDIRAVMDAAGSESAVMSAPRRERRWLATSPLPSLSGSRPRSSMAPSRG